MNVKLYQCIMRSKYPSFECAHADDLYIVKREVERGDMRALQSTEVCIICGKDRPDTIDDRNICSFAKLLGEVKIYKNLDLRRLS